MKFRLVESSNNNYDKIVYRVGEIKNDEFKNQCVFFAEKLEYFNYSITGYNKEDAEPYLLNTKDFKVFDPMKQWEDKLTAINNWNDIRTTEEFCREVGLESYISDYLVDIDYDDPNEYHEVILDTDSFAMYGRDCGYDITILRDIPIDYAMEFTEYAVHNSNCIKRLNAKTFDKNSSNINEDMSNEYDNEGHQLTKEQSEFFKDSKVRDEQGRLLVCYHGDTENRPLKGTYYSSKGMWFTTSKTTADVYAEYDLRTSYLNIINPFVVDCNYSLGRDTPNIINNELFRILDWNKVVYWSNLYYEDKPQILESPIYIKDSNLKEFKKLLCSYMNLNSKYIDIWESYNDIRLKLSDNLLNIIPNADKYIYVKNNVNIKDNLAEINNDTLCEYLSALAITIRDGVEKCETTNIVSTIFNNYRRKYDGVIFKNIAVGDDINDFGNVVVIFMAKQEKSIDNKTPTNSNNINEDTYADITWNKEK